MINLAASTEAVDAKSRASLVESMRFRCSISSVFYGPLVIY